jgi:prepilin-type N-terminal cleavage/methylation domain-containing protein
MDATHLILQHRRLAMASDDRAVSMNAEFTKEGACLPPSGERRIPPPTKRPRHQALAFTLVELLVVVALIAILAGLILAAAQTVAQRAREMKEVQAGRTLITAYSAYPIDHDGQLLPAYDRTVATLSLPDGTVVSGPPAERYPYRLAPYFKNQINGVVLVNGNTTQIDTTSDYLVSCYPAFGINYMFVGGDISDTGMMTYPGDCVTRMGNSASILVFATAAGDSTPTKISGYCILTPPETTDPMWSSAPWDSTAAAASYGNVDPRYGSGAICVFLDGSIRTLTIDQLRDMRLWSYNAARQNNPNYGIYQPPPPGGR